MSRNSAVRPYRWLARYYDQLFKLHDTPLDPARDRCLRRILPNVATACDLACGTGRTALILARGGRKVYAVDLSPDMCRVTREKVKRSGLAVKVLRADMRSFELPDPVDLITCEFDALNHVPRASDLRSVAKSVARALRPGGHFFFDVNNALGFERYWTGNVWLEKPGIVAVMRNGHNRQCTKAWADIEWFIQSPGRSWRRYSERVEEVCWTRETIEATFRRAGFDSIREWDEAPFWKNNPMIKRGCRSVYLARKAQ
jgi:SAM-dependent methyltransferase